jgi:hypothetical protein
MKKEAILKRTICALLLPLFLASAATAQTLAEAAQKEKERREAMKSKPGVVVTNADLAKTRKKPAAAFPAGGAGTEAPPGTQAEDAGVAAEANRIEADRQAEIRKRFDEKKAALEARATQAKERAELLDLKLKSLQQQFHTYANMQTKDRVQQQIVETYQVLQAAAAEQVRAKAELDQFLETGAKDKAAAAGIKGP